MLERPRLRFLAEFAADLGVIVAMSVLTRVVSRVLSLLNTVFPVPEHADAQISYLPLDLVRTAATALDVVTILMAVVMATVALLRYASEGFVRTAARKKQRAA